MTKTCTKCGIDRALTDFQKCQGKKDGLSSWCNECRKVYLRARYANNAEKEKARCTKWRKENPEKVKITAANWYVKAAEKEKKRLAKWRAANRQRTKESNAAWRRRNPEACRMKDNNRRAREQASGGVLSKGLAERLFDLQKGKCACGCGLPLGDDFHRDHIMPLALGGTNTDDNIQLLKAGCNLQKSKKHPIVFMQERGFLL